MNSTKPHDWYGSFTLLPLLLLLLLLPYSLNLRILLSLLIHRPWLDRRFACHMLGTALGNADHGRPQHPLTDRIAGLHDLDHRVGRHLRIGHLEHRLVEIR